MVQAKRPQKPAAPRWRRRKDDRPDEILAAALEEFAARGFASTRVDDVTARAGVTKGTVYLYFPNKEELFKAVVRQSLVPNLKIAEEMFRAHRGPVAKLLQDIVARLAGAVAGTRLGVIPKLVIGEAGNFPDLARFYVEEVATRGLRLFAGIIERGIQQGEFRAVDPFLAAPVIIGPLLLLALWKNVLEPHAPRMIDGAGYMDAYRNIMFNGLLQPGGSR